MYLGGVKPASEVFDLLERDGTRHSNHKAVAFVAIVVALTIIWTNLLAGTRALAWPEVALLAFIVAASYGVGVIKLLIQFGYAVVAARWPTPK